jgi:oxaloacetate decarboxylase alpha subunit
MILNIAVLNVTGRERYGIIPDEVIRYALGRFGRPNIPIDASVMDRIMSLPRTREIMAEPPPQSVNELRRRLGAHLADEELLLRATMPANLIDAMQAAGPAPREYDPALRPVLRLIRGLCARRDLASILVEKPGFRLHLQGNRA